MPACTLLAFQVCFLGCPLRLHSSGRSLLSTSWFKPFFSPSSFLGNVYCCPLKPLEHYDILHLNPPTSRKPAILFPSFGLYLLRLQNEHAHEVLVYSHLATAPWFIIFFVVIDSENCKFQAQIYLKTSHIRVCRAGHMREDSQIHQVRPVYSI
jgi:hypothetical protein